jgi:hypothetical protein
MGIADIEEATGLGWSTIDRYKKGQWSRDPLTGHVQKLCGGLGISLDEAYAALEWAAEPARDNPSPEPALDHRLRAVARRLSDPNVSVLEKLQIQAVLDSMAKGKFAPEE